MSRDRARWQRTRRRRAPVLRVVEPKRRRRLPLAVAAFLVLAPLVFGVVVMQTMVSQTSFRMEQVSSRQAALQQSYDELKLEVAELSAPGRIAEEAARLGLRLPDPGQVHTLDVNAEPASAGEAPTNDAAYAIRALLGNAP